MVHYRAVPHRGWVPAKPAGGNLGCRPLRGGCRALGWAAYIVQWPPYPEPRACVAWNTHPIHPTSTLSGFRVPLCNGMKTFFIPKRGRQPLTISVWDLDSFKVKGRGLALGSLPGVGTTPFAPSFAARANTHASACGPRSHEGIATLLY